MLKALVQKWFSGILVAETDLYVLSYRNRIEQISWGLLGRTIAIEAVVFLKTDEIPFTELSSCVFSALEEQELRTPSRVDCTWLVCSSRGGIYLYEALAVKEHVRTGKIKSRFLTLNTDDGTVCFGPGHIYNKRYTERMRDLLSSIRTMPSEKFGACFGSIMDECMEMSRS